jgi:type II secretory pathway component PulK
MKRIPGTHGAEIGRNTGRRGRTARGSRGGVILILVLWIFAALSLFLYSFLANARVDLQISAGCADRLRADAIAHSALEYALIALLEDSSQVAGPWSLWYDNADRFKDVEITDPAGGRDPFGLFTVFSSGWGSGTTPFRYGPQDEAAKVNLNTAPREVLLRLTPRMTDAIVDAIIDWRDTDDVSGSAGAESSYYLSLSRPYRCKNAPFESLEELLYVRGVDPMVLYGEDWNRNGVLDPNEDDGTQNDPPDNADGRLEFGLWHLCTIYSVDSNRTNDGGPRVNINTASPVELQSALGDRLTSDQVRSIVSGRGAGPYTSIAALLMLPGWDKESFQAVADRLTIVDTPQIRGLVNVNTAPREVLQALPGMTEDLAAAVVAYRIASQKSLDNVGWLLNVVDRNAFLQVANWITVRSSQFSMQCVGWIPPRPGHPPVFSRAWMVVDRLATPPRVLAIKDLTALGFPYPLPEVDNAAGPK